jgi:hypothetical protein
MVGKKGNRAWAFRRENDIMDNSENRIEKIKN